MPVASISFTVKGPVRLGAVTLKVIVFEVFLGTLANVRSEGDTVIARFTAVPLRVTVLLEVSPPPEIVAVALWVPAEVGAKKCQ